MHSWVFLGINTSIMYSALIVYQAPCYVCGLHMLSHLILTHAQFHRDNKFQSWYSHLGLSDFKAGACNNKDHVTLFWRRCAQMEKKKKRAVWNSETKQQWVAARIHQNQLCRQERNKQGPLGCRTDRGEYRSRPPKWRLKTLSPCELSSHGNIFQFLARC